MPAYMTPEALLNHVALAQLLGDPQHGPERTVWLIHWLHRQPDLDVDDDASGEGGGGEQE